MTRPLFFPTGGAHSTDAVEHIVSRWTIILVDDFPQIELTPTCNPGTQTSALGAEREVHDGPDWCRDLHDRGDSDVVYSASVDTATATCSSTETATPSSTVSPPTYTPTDTPTATTTIAASPTASAPPTVSPTPTATVGCGNGVIEPGEQCDDGNHLSDDACPAECSYSASGSLIRGNRRNPRGDGRACQVEWYVRESTIRRDHFGLPDWRQTCVDGDSGCDLDPLPGRCGFEVVLCLNTDDINLRGCADGGVARATVRHAGSAVHNSTARQLAERNVAKVQAALAALLDPADPSAGYTHGPPLTAAQRNLCSAPMHLEVLSASGRAHESDRVAQTLTVVSIDDGVPRAHRRVSRLRLKCQARRLP